MNKKQKIVLFVTLGIIVVMGLFPPWYYRAVLIKGDQHIPFEWDAVLVQREME